MTHSFANAIESLDTNERTLVTQQLEQWLSGPCSTARQVSLNIRTETALSTDAFVSLLTDFCAELKRSPHDARAGWEAACRRHKLKGSQVPAPGPALLGRALPLERYAKHLARAARLSDATSEELIRKVILAGNTPVPREARLLRQAPLGRFLIWATFRDDDRHPFDHLPHTNDAVRTALGLGECSAMESFVLISWRRTGSYGTLSIHRPTVADAEMYSWYRPVTDAAATCGSTAPLLPNPDCIQPCPEVVHHEITGETLLFPIFLAV